MAKTLKTEGIVLRKRNLLNKDLLITLLTKELGKINIFAKGVKKITSKRSPHIQTANLLNLLLSKKDERFYLQETNLISAFSQIKNNQNKINLLYFFLFVIDRLSPENQVEIEVYDLLKKFLIDLSNKKDFNEKNLIKYINDLLFLQGYIKEDKSWEDLRFTIEEIIHEKLPNLQL